MYKTGLMEGPQVTHLFLTTRRQAMSFFFPQKSFPEQIDQYLSRQDAFTRKDDDIIPGSWGKLWYKRKKKKKKMRFWPKDVSQCIVKGTPYPSSLGGVYQPFFSWICTRDLYDCCALARLYWFLLAPNCTRALPLTRVAFICIMTDSME